MSTKEHRKQGNEITVNQWQMLYKTGAATACLVILGTILDIIIGTMLGGDLSEIPKTAVERYEQFQSSTLLGLYNLDFVLLSLANLLLSIGMLRGRCLGEWPHGSEFLEQQCFYAI